MSGTIYAGPFKDHLQNHVELKQAVGYKYDTDADHLKRFDRFTLEKYPQATVLTKEIVLDWCSKKTYEAQANQCSRASIIRKRTGKKPLSARADEMLTLHFSRIISQGLTDMKYNFEYFLNRGYAFNRDKGKCRVCGEKLQSDNLHIHHTNPHLPLNKVNRVNNLAAVHDNCHRIIHSQLDTHR